MTAGEFFLVLAKLSTRYKGGQPILKVLVSKHAKECGLDIDEDGPYGELNEIVVPLEKFLKAVSGGADALYQYAHACLAWEAYERYLAHKDVRIRAAALAEQSRRRRLTFRS